MPAISIADIVNPPKRVKIGVLSDRRIICSNQKRKFTVYGLFSWMQRNNLYYELRWDRKNPPSMYDIYVFARDLKSVKNGIRECLN